jgi:hypothetical protein
MRVSPAGALAPVVPGGPFFKSPCLLRCPSGEDGATDLDVDPASEKIALAAMVYCINEWRE